MKFEYPGYVLNFIQKKPCNDASAHLFTLIYKFYSPVTKYFYILHADYHEEHVFAIKFYAKKDRKSDYKYSKITNKGDLPNILITCLKVVPMLLSTYPNVSFAFIGSRTFDKKSKRVEDYRNTQRFRVYKYIVSAKIGDVTFQHIEYESISGYLLVNRIEANVEAKEHALIDMFTITYDNVLNV